MSRKKKRCEEVPVSSIMLGFNAAILHLVASMSDGSDPFVLTEKDGKLYGHGSSDDKGPVLGWLHAVSAYNATKTEIPINLKVWKSKMKDHYHHSYQKNPFQKYGDGYGRYNNNLNILPDSKSLVSKLQMKDTIISPVIPNQQNLNILPDSKSLVSKLQMKDTIISPVIPNQQNLNILPDSKSLVSNLQMKDTIISPVIPNQQNLNILPDSKSLVSNLQMKDTIISPVIPNQQDLLFLDSSEHSPIKIVGFTLQYAAPEVFKQNSGGTVCS